MENRIYYRLKTKNAVYIFTRQEVLRALDRENMGVVGEVKEENDVWKKNKKS
jgi:hypothetical protein